MSKALRLLSGYQFAPEILRRASQAGEGQDAGEMGAKLLIAIDGDRYAIYAGRETSKPLALNRLAAEAAARSGAAFIDLHPVFAAAWKASGRRFEFESDAHWNEYGNAVAAHAIAAALRNIN